MTSPYVDPKAQEYSGGSNNKDVRGQPSVSFVTGIGFASSSDSTMRILEPKANMVPDMRMHDARMKQNRGHSYR